MNRYRRLGWYLPGVPSLLRLLLLQHSRRDRRRVTLESRGRDEEITAWFQQHRLFFGFGLYRSGTTFLSRLLDTHAISARVCHEPNISDYPAYAAALSDGHAAYSYLQSYRKAEIWLRMRNDSCDVYGEVNPYLRRHAQALRECFPDTPMFQLVRDGRDVVRSLYSRELFARHDPMAKLIRPPPEDPYAARWKSMQRFEKLCWLWQADNRYLRETLGSVVQLEQLLNDYSYFNSRVLIPAGLVLARPAWQEAAAAAVNPTPKYRAPSWQDWPSRWRESFEQICGDEMSACGYVR